MRNEETGPRLTTWVRTAVAAACTIMVLQATNAAAMTADDCQKLSMDALMAAVDQGLCTLDAQPAAGPAQVADNSHSGGNSNGGSGGGGWWQ